MTLELLDALAKKGIRRVKVVPDEDYERVIAKKYFESLLKNKNKIKEIAYT